MLYYIIIWLLGNYLIIFLKVLRSMDLIFRYLIFVYLYLKGKENYLKSDV